MKYRKWESEEQVFTSNIMNIKSVSKYVTRLCEISRHSPVKTSQKVNPCLIAELVSFLAIEPTRRVVASACGAGLLTAVISTLTQVYVALSSAELLRVMGAKNLS